MNIENTKRVYVDTSLYLSVLMNDPRGSSFSKILEGKVFCSSVLLLVEAERNLVFLSREQKLSVRDYQSCMTRLREDRELFILRDVTEDLCLTGTFPPVRTPRSNDLIHLRTAQWFQVSGGLDYFLTLDHKQHDAAVDLGLPVVS